MFAYAKIVKSDWQTVLLVHFVDQQFLKKLKFFCDLWIKWGEGPYEISKEDALVYE